MLSFVIWLLCRCWWHGTWMGEVMGELGWYLIRETTKANSNTCCHSPFGWEFISERVIRGGSTDLPGLERWQMTRHCRSSSGFHVAVGNVAPQITVAVGRGQVCGGRAVVWIVAVVLCCGCVVVMVNRVGWEEGGRGYLPLCKHKQKLWTTTSLSFIIWHLPFHCVNVGRRWWHGVATSLLLWWLWGNGCGRQRLLA